MSEHTEIQSVQLIAPAAAAQNKAERKSLRRAKAAIDTKPAKAVETTKAPEAQANATPRAKARPKAAEKPSFVVRKIAKGKGIYVLDQDSRPQSGPMLLAHTHAALTILGLIDAARPAVPKTQLLTLIGQRAVAYHLNLGNLESAPDHAVRLSLLGYNKFSNRMRDGKINVEAANAYVAAFLDGKPDPSIRVNKSNLYPVAF